MQNSHHLLFSQMSCSYISKTYKEYLLHIMSFDYPSIFLKNMFEVERHKQFLPELFAMVGCGQNQYHEHDVWTHTIITVDACKKDPILRMAALLHDIGKPAAKTEENGKAMFKGHETVGAEMAEKFLIRLEFYEQDIDKIVKIVRYHYIKYDSSWSNAAVRRWKKKVGDIAEDLFELARADIIGKGNAKTKLDLKLIDDLEMRYKNYNVEEPESLIKLAINGNQIMEKLGIRPGAEVGRMLKILNNAVSQDPNINNTEDLMKIVEENKYEEKKS